MCFWIGLYLQNFLNLRWFCDLSHLNAIWSLSRNQKCMEASQVTFKVIVLYSYFKGFFLLWILLFCSLDNQPQHTSIWKREKSLSLSVLNVDDVLTLETEWGWVLLVRRAWTCVRKEPLQRDLKTQTWPTEKCQFIRRALSLVINLLFKSAFFVNWKMLLLFSLFLINVVSKHVTVCRKGQCQSSIMRFEKMSLDYFPHESIEKHQNQCNN